MAPNRRLLALPVLLFAAWSSGCIDWYIAAPQQSVILAQVDAHQRDVFFPQTPILRQRQLGLFNPSLVLVLTGVGAPLIGFGAPLIPIGEFRPDLSFAQRPELPLEGVALCTSYDFSDILITIMTLTLVTSYQVHIYADVR